MNPYERLARWYKWVTWFGIVLNALFIFPLVFAPEFILRLLDLYVDPILWARVSGMLLFIISAFYIPASFNLKKYRINAWLAILPSRACGATFFIVAVFVFGFPLGYLPIGFVDLTILSIQLVILLNIRRIERDEPGFGKWINATALGVVLAAMIGSSAWYTVFRVVPQQLASDTVEEFYKYGSIGGEEQQGIPYWLWLVMPKMCAHHLPGPGGYAGLGLPWEQGREMPIGFSKKTIGFERVAFNCAFCHTATVRTSVDDPVPSVYPGGPSHTFNALAYQRFLFNCASDEVFTTKDILNEIAKIKKLSILDSLQYRILIPIVKKTLLKQKEDFAWTDTRPDWGPGRIDPFNPIKVAILQDVNPKVGVKDTIGNADMVPIWNMRPREGMDLHWDGLNPDLTEVTLSSAIGDGATPKNIPLDDLQRLQDWLLDLKPPAYPFLASLDQALADRGSDLYEEHCASCHAFGGEQTGTTLPVGPEDEQNKTVDTDPHRAEMWTPEAAQAYNDYAKDYPWDFERFQSLGGYASVPLDGVWIRAPFLHNGSVPSLTDLLEPPAKRPKVFYRGSDVYDPEKVGFLSSGPHAERNGFKYDTAEAGNSNEGHLWGTDLSSEDKKALVEYMKTL